VYQNSDWISLQGKAKHSGADMILTTEKDAVKVKQFVQRDEFLWVVHISVEVISGEERLEHKLGVPNG
jgi:tetraacyldisaccharide 4'-kinase